MNESLLIFQKGGFIKKDKGHVSIVQKDKYNWIHFNPLHYKLKWMILPFESNESFEHVSKLYFKSGASEILKICLEDIHYKKTTPFRFFVTCTDLIQYILGIQKKFFTPSHLYNFLISSSVQSLNKYSISEVVDMRKYL